MPADVQVCVQVVAPRGDGVSEADEYSPVVAVSSHTQVGSGWLQFLLFSFPPSNHFSFSFCCFSVAF